MKRIVRKLTCAEAAKYDKARKLIKAEIPEIIARHHEREELYEQLRELFKALKQARKAKGVSLSFVSKLTGMDCSALSKLETGKRPNPTIDTLARYAEAVGRRLGLSLE